MSDGTDDMNQAIRRAAGHKVAPPPDVEHEHDETDDEEDMNTLLRRGRNAVPPAAA